VTDDGIRTARAGRLFWAETALAVLTASLAILTSVWPAWIEAVFGFDPDHHNGSFEWELTLALAVVTLILGALARRTWARRARLLSACTASELGTGV
jgi:hypothetical protein